MLPEQVAWDCRAVLALHLLRLAVGWTLVSLIYPVFFYPIL